MLTSWQPSDPPPAVVAHPPAASLDEAHAAIEQWEHYSGKQLDSAQRLAVEHMMAEDERGYWAAGSTGRAMSRQNGKGDEIEVVEQWGLTQRAEAIVHTAHEIPTAKSAHQRLVAFLESHADLRRLRKQVRYANGDQAIIMHNGGIIVYRTRTAGGGRGLDDISRLVVDEAQHAQPEQLASSTPILSANPNPQINYIGSAGVADKSAFWWRLRKQALSPDPGRFAWLEHSAEAVVMGDDGRIRSTVGPVADRSLWKKANPAYPGRISDDFLAGQLRDLGPELFAREHLCVWDPDPDSVGFGPVDMEIWSQLAQVSQITRDRSWALSVSPDRKHAAIGIAGRREDGLYHVEWMDHRAGTAWVLDRCVEVFAAKRIPLRVHAQGAEASFIRELEEAGVDVVQVPTAEVARATGDFIDAVNNRTLRHLGQRTLDMSLQRAALRTTETGASIWAEKSSEADITTLKAVTVALGGIEQRSAPRIHTLRQEVTAR